MDYMSMLKPKSEVKQGYSFLIVGPWGTGKTSIFDDANMNILVLDVEKGSAVLPDRTNILIPPEGINNYLDVLTWLERLEQSVEFRTQIDLVLLDGMGRFFELCMRHAMEITPQVNRMADGVPQKADWNHFPRLFKETIKRFHELTKRPDNLKPFYVGIIGHTAEDKNEVSGLTEYKINLQGKDTSDVVASIVDLVGFQNIVFELPKDAPEGAPPEKSYVLFLQPGVFEHKRFNAKIRVFKEVVHKAPKALRNPSIKRLIAMLDYLKAEQVKVLNPQPEAPAAVPATEGAGEA